jgi:hypothetical protein
MPANDPPGAPPLPPSGQPKDSQQGQSRKPWTPEAVLNFLALLGGAAAVIASLAAVAGGDPVRWGVCATVAAAVFYFKDRIDAKVSAAVVISLGILALYYMSERTNTDACLAEAARLDKAYAIRAATYYVRMERSSEGMIHQSRRMTYVLHAMRRITGQETNLFQEGFDTHLQNAAGIRAAAIPWPGTQAEVRSDHLAYAVLLDMNPGQQRTVMTGADFLVAYPFKREAAEGAAHPLNPKEDDFRYQNGSGESKGDALCELTIVVESSTLKLDQGALAASRSIDGNQPPIEAKVNGSRWSVSAHFPHMASGELALLKVRLAD